jgi:hypothetical protein
LFGAQISTIHAFCARVLRDNPLEAGIDPHAVVLDEYDSRDYLERTIEAELMTRLRAGDAGARLLMARTRGLYGARRGGAVRVLGRLLDGLARFGVDGPWLVARLPGLSTRPRCRGLASGTRPDHRAETCLPRRAARRSRRSAAMVACGASGWSGRPHHARRFMALIRWRAGSGAAGGVGRFLRGNQDRPTAPRRRCGAPPRPRMRGLAALVAEVARAVEAQTR